MPGAQGDITFAVLAGGEGSRMGRPKGLLTVAGRPILEHILRTARWDGPTMLVTAPGRESPPGAKVFDLEVNDPVAGLGPLRGILTALEKATTEQIVVAPVDMPLIGAAPIGWLAGAIRDRPAAAALLMERVYRQETIIEPLPAAFRRSAVDLLKQRIDRKQLSLHSLVGCDGIQTVRIPGDWPEEIWNNLNYPGDMAAVDQRAR